MTATTAIARPSSARKCLVARQPVFEPGRQVFGYELLFHLTEGHPAGVDGDPATVLSNTLSVFGLHQLAEGRRAFIKFSRPALLQGHAYLLPREQAVIELPNLKGADAEALEQCYRLKKDGYVLATSCPPPGVRGDETVVDVADIVRVNFRAATPDERREHADRFSACGKRLLAEKVENWQEFRDSTDSGYSYFQGSFFCRPEVLAAKELPPARVSVLRLMAELNRPRVDVQAVEQVIKRDPPLTLKLLAFLNSALIGRRYEVTSIRRAVVLLGLTNLRRWVSLFAVGSLSEGAPPELFRICLIRACFCELVAARAGLVGLEFELFLAGLLSSLDAILGRPLAELLDSLAVSDNVRNALAAREDKAGLVYGLVRAYEDGDWTVVGDATAALGLEADAITEDYLQSLRWAADTSGQARAGR